MKKYAVLTLLFLLAGIGFSGPVLTRGSSQTNDQSASLSKVFPDWPIIISGDSLLATSYAYVKSATAKTKNPTTIKVLLTAYSSSYDETDDTPFITASGAYVQSGVVAANFLPLGTKIRVPELFGNQVFVVEDRLRRDYNDRIDIWFPSKEQALNFGSKISKVEIL